MRKTILAGLTAILIMSVPTVKYINLKHQNQILLDRIDQLNRNNESKDIRIKSLILNIEDLENEIEQFNKEKLEVEQSVEEVNEEINQEYETRIFKVTAYCPCESCCGIWSGGKTASGTQPTQGRTIAVDPSVIPYGTEIVLNGHTYIAEDCGGAIKGDRIDIYFDSHSEALDFGVKYLEGVIKK